MKLTYRVFDDKEASAGLDELGGWRRCNAHDFLQTRDTERHVLARYTSIMERV
jgi:hypothetical protein